MFTFGYIQVGNLRSFSSRTTTRSYSTMTMPQVQCLSLMAQLIILITKAITQTHLLRSFIPALSILKPRPCSVALLAKLGMKFEHGGPSMKKKNIKLLLGTTYARGISSWSNSRRHETIYLTRIHKTNYACVRTSILDLN